MRKIVIFITVLLLLGSISGCVLREETTTVPTSTSLDRSDVTVPQSTAAPLDPSALPVLTQERMALIEAHWDIYCNGANLQRFRDPEKGKDGIRYYGSYTVENWDGTPVTFDILYVPFPELAVPTTVELQGYRFSSRHGFALYTFTLYTGNNGEIGMRWANFAPLLDWERIDDGIIAYAFELHQRYEDMVGKQQTVNTPVGEEYERQRVRAAWLHCLGFLPDFENAGKTQRYYGKFDGYDVFYCASEGSPGVHSNIVIGQETFVNGPFQLRVHKDGCFYELRDAYAAGLISDDTLSKIAQTHNQLEEK